LKAQLLRGQISALDAKLADLISQPQDSAQVLQFATAPGSPSSPRPKRDAILAFLAALILALGVAWARVALADRYGSAEEAAEDLGLRMLGEIPRGRRDQRANVEAFRRLRTVVALATGHRDSYEEVGA